MGYITNNYVEKGAEAPWIFLFLGIPTSAGLKRPLRITRRLRLFNLLLLRRAPTVLSSPLFNANRYHFIPPVLEMPGFEPGSCSFVNFLHTTITNI